MFTQNKSNVENWWFLKFYCKIMIVQSNTSEVGAIKWNLKYNKKQLKIIS